MEKMLIQQSKPKVDKVHVIWVILLGKAADSMEKRSQPP